MRRTCLLLLAASVLWAQPDARELVRESIRNGEKAWERSLTYSCVKRDVGRQFDGRGRVKNVDDDVYEMVPVGPVSFEKLVTHDGRPPDADTAAKANRELRGLQAAGPAQKAARLRKLKRERAYMLEVPDAFNFRIVGEENLPTGPAWVLEAAPRPGYRPKSRYARMFSKMRGTLWIDKKDVQWVKADAEAMDTVSFGFFIARLAKGSHITLEQTRLADGAWVPHRISARASARTFVVFNHNFEENITYSDYRRAGAPAVGAAERAKR